MARGVDTPGFSRILKLSLDAAIAMRTQPQTSTIQVQIKSIAENNNNSECKKVIQNAQNTDKIIAQGLKNIGKKGDICERSVCKSSRGRGKSSVEQSSRHNFPQSKFQDCAASSNGDSHSVTDHNVSVKETARNGTASTLTNCLDLYEDKCKREIMFREQDEDKALFIKQEMCEFPDLIKCQMSPEEMTDTSMVDNVPCNVSNMRKPAMTNCQLSGHLEFDHNTTERTSHHSVIIASETRPSNSYFKGRYKNENVQKAPSHPAVSKQWKQVRPHFTARGNKIVGHTLQEQSRNHIVQEVQPDRTSHVDFHVTKAAILTRQPAVGIQRQTGIDKSRRLKSEEACSLAGGVFKPHVPDSSRKFVDNTVDQTNKCLTATSDHHPLNGQVNRHGCGNIIQHVRPAGTVAHKTRTAETAFLKQPRRTVNPTCQNDTEFDKNHHGVTYLPEQLDELVAFNLKKPKEGSKAWGQAVGVDHSVYKMIDAIYQSYEQRTFSDGDRQPGASEARLVIEKSTCKEFASVEGSTEDEDISEHLISAATCEESVLYAPRKKDTLTSDEAELVQDARSPQGMTTHLTNTSSLLSNHTQTCPPVHGLTSDEAELVQDARSPQGMTTHLTNTSSLLSNHTQTCPPVHGLTSDEAELVQDARSPQGMTTHLTNTSSLLSNHTQTCPPVHGLTSDEAELVQDARSPQGMTTHLTNTSSLLSNHTSELSSSSGIASSTWSQANHANEDDLSCQSVPGTWSQANHANEDDLSCQSVPGTWSQANHANEDDLSCQSVPGKKLSPRNDACSYHYSQDHNLPCEVSVPARGCCDEGHHDGRYDDVPALAEDHPSEPRAHLDSVRECQGYGSLYHTSCFQTQELSLPAETFGSKLAMDRMVAFLKSCSTDIQKCMSKCNEDHPVNVTIKVSLTPSSSSAFASRLPHHPYPSRTKRLSTHNYAPPSMHQAPIPSPASSPYWYWGPWTEWYSSNLGTSINNEWCPGMMCPLPPQANSYRNMPAVPDYPNPLMYPSWSSSQFDYEQQRPERTYPNTVNPSKTWRNGWTEEMSADSNNISPQLHMNDDYDRQQMYQTEAETDRRENEESRGSLEKLKMSASSLEARKGHANHGRDSSPTLVGMSTKNVPPAAESEGVHISTSSQTTSTLLGQTHTPVEVHMLTGRPQSKPDKSKASISRQECEALEGSEQIPHLHKTQTGKRRSTPPKVARQKQGYQPASSQEKSNVMQSQLTQDVRHLSVGQPVSSERSICQPRDAREDGELNPGKSPSSSQASHIKKRARATEMARLFVTRSRTYQFRFIDTHCHIDFLYSRLNIDSSTPFYKFRENYADTFPDNYEGCVAVFCNPNSFTAHNPKNQILKSVAAEDGVWLAVGCHPKSATDFEDTHLLGLRQVLKHHKVVALGEIGLDYSGTFGQHSVVQKHVFRQQIDIALEMRLPIVVHCRDADDDCLEILIQSLPHDYKIHAHCFTRDMTVANRWLNSFPNLFLGLTPLVTYKSAVEATNTATHIPLDRLLLETDAPYFVPGIVRNGSIEYSHPGFALCTAERVAELKNIPVDEVLRACRENTRKMYGI